MRYKSLLAMMILLAVSTLGCELTACDLNPFSAVPASTPAPGRVGPPDEQPAPPIGGACDPATTRIDTNRVYDENMHSTDAGYPANCLYYCVSIPAGEDGLTIALSDFNVDLDLYVGYGTLSAVQTSDTSAGEGYWISNEFDTVDEEVNIRSPEGGLYYIEICSYDGSPSPFRLEASLR